MRPRGSPRVFVQVAQKWLRFHEQLESPPPNRFHRMIAEFIDAMRSVYGLAPDTVRGYSSRAFNFLKWFGERHESLESVSLLDVDEFLASKRQEGWSVRSIASQCQALRSFFRYAEIRGWCAPGWRWEFVVREFRNTMAGPKLQRGRRSGDYSTLRADRHLAIFAPRLFSSYLRSMGFEAARWPDFN